MVAAQALGFSSLALLIEAAGLCRSVGARFLARFGFLRGLAQQVDEAQQSVCSVLFLGAVLVSFNDEHAPGGNAAASQRQQAGFDFRGEGRGIGDVEAQLDGGGNFVYVLASWAGGTDEVKLGFVLVN